MPAANLAVVFQPGLIRPPDVPFHKAEGTAGQSSDEALAPPAPLPQLSRTSSNPLASKAMTASSTDDGQAQTTELQRRQDEIKINQEVLEFLINHQDHFVALPEMASSSEVSPVSPTSGSGQSKKSVAGPSVAQASPAFRRPQTPQQPPQTQQRMQATQTSPIVQPAAQRTESPRPTQASQQRGAAVPSSGQLQIQAQGQATSHQSQSQARQPAMTVKNPTSPPILAPTPMRQPQPHPAQSQPQSQPSIQKSYRDADHRPASPGRFRDQEAHGPTNASTPLQQTQVLPASQTRAPPTQGPGHESPVLASSQQQAPTRTSKSSKDTKDLEKQKDTRKPRKLKKGRTPTGSGANTPLSPPPVMWETSQGLPPAQYPYPTSPYHSSSTPPAHYDEDTPLSQGLPTGPGVKRSRTLPSPGEKGSTVRRVCVFLPIRSLTILSLTDL